jgi:methylated-DNA-[protein]-cysteine S-methyltransferase
MKLLNGHFETPIGKLRAQITEDGRLWELAFVNRRGKDDAHPAFARIRRQLEQYFEGKRTSFELELAERGTEFQRAVWSELAKIPAGSTISYAELARRVDREGAVRAVGAANGANPWCIVVPCHRVVGSSGDLTGYSGGIARKKALLELERAAAKPVKARA